MQCWSAGQESAFHRDVFAVLLIVIQFMPLLIGTGVQAYEQRKNITKWWYGEESPEDIARDFRRRPTGADAEKGDDSPKSPSYEDEPSKSKSEDDPGVKEQTKTWRSDEALELP